MSNNALDAKEAEVLREMGYDPETHFIVGDVRVSRWQSGDNWNTSYKAKVAERPSGASVDELVARLKRHRKHTPQPTGDWSFVVNLADWQIGKKDGDGVSGTTDRLLQMVDDVESRIRELRRLKRPIGHLVIAGLADLAEGCVGHYASQTFSVELNRREQLRLVRALLTEAISRWAKLFDRVTVLAVPGNHGENRLDGKAFTSVGDNDDVAVFEAVKEAFDMVPEAYGHIEWILPENQIEVVLPIGPGVCFTHGHIAGRGATPQEKQVNWWKGQVFGGLAAGNAQILVTAHFHHFQVSERSGRLWLQCPAQDGGSDWFERATGEWSRPGTLTFVVTDTWVTDIAVLG